MLDVPKDYIVARFKAFDKLPNSVKTKILKDPMICSTDFINECGLQNFVLSIGQLALDMSLCQSPIEMLLYVALEKIRYRSDIWEIELQKEMVCNGKKYRADFLISFGGDRMTSESRFIVVECDGHDFHERTKSQASRDKQRDRDMQSDGYAVMRFTGSEIYKNADGCANEIAHYIAKNT